MKFSIRTLMFLTILIATCFAAQDFLELGASIALGLTGCCLLFRHVVLAMAVCYVAFLLLPYNGFMPWLLISIAIFSWPWLENVFERMSKRKDQ